MNLLGINGPRAARFSGNNSYHSSARPTVGVREVVHAAAAIFDIPAHQIYGPGRQRPICRARQAIYSVAAAHGWGYAHIGRIIGVDHSSVSHGCGKADIYRHYEPEFDRRYQMLVDATSRTRGAPVKNPTDLAGSGDSVLIDGRPLLERTA